MKSLRENELNHTLKLIQDTYLKIKDEMNKAIIGQDNALELMIISLLSEGHSILHGVPGLAKTLMVGTLAKVFSASFSRIQFTPDLIAV